MAIGTSDDALLDLSSESSETNARADQHCDRIPFLSKHVVELQHAGIGFAVIHARLQAQKVEYVAFVAFSIRNTILTPMLAMSRPIGAIVSALVYDAAIAADAMPPLLLLVFELETPVLFGLKAGAARFHFNIHASKKCAHEREG